MIILIPFNSQLDVFPSILEEFGIEKEQKKSGNFSKSV